MIKIEKAQFSVEINAQESTRFMEKANFDGRF